MTSQDVVRQLKEIAVEITEMSAEELEEIWPWANGLADGLKRETILSSRWSGALWRHDMTYEPMTADKRRKGGTVSTPAVASSPLAQLILGALRQAYRAGWVQHHNRPESPEEDAATERIIEIYDLPSDAGADEGTL